MPCQQFCGVPALTMAILHLVVSCLVQQLASAALIQDPATTEANTAKGCDSLRLAQQYTYCAVPFYVDYHEKDVPEHVLCAQARIFKQCAEKASETSGCANQEYQLRSTFRYYTATILAPYVQLCKIEITVEAANSYRPGTHVVHSGNKSRNGVLGKRQLGEDYYHDESGRENYDYPNHPKGDLIVENVHEVHMTDRSGTDSSPPRALGGNHESTMSFTTDGNGRTNNVTTSSPVPVTRNTSETTQSQPGTAGTNVAPPEKPVPADLHTPVQKLPTDLELPGTPPTEYRGRIQQVSTCGPMFDPSYAYPAACEKKFFLRRFFTCGIHFQSELEITANNCSCYVSYLECIKKARDENQCAQPGADDKDPILISVKVLTELMSSIYGNACFNKSGNVTASRSRSRICCDEVRGLKHAVMCYASYFYLSDVKTPALWPSPHGSCSLVNDLKRCADFAQQQTQCTSCTIGHHIKQFVGAVIQPHRSQCDTGATGVQSLGAYMRDNCDTPRVMKRTLRCSLTFQDMIDLEGTVRPKNLLCGHASRLHACLEDTVANTGCRNDAHVSSQVKMYKKILEDTYVVHCNVLALRERSYVRQAFELAGPVSTFRNQHQSRVFVLNDVDQPESDNQVDKDQEQYSSILEHAAKKLRLLSPAEVQRSKLDVEGSWEALNKLQAEKQRRNSGGRQNDQARWVNRKFRSWQALKQRAGQSISGMDNGGFRTNMTRDIGSLGGEERGVVIGRMPSQPARGVYQHHSSNVNAPENKKWVFQDDYFLGNDYAEHGQVSASQGQLQQLPHLNAAVPNIQNVMQEVNTTSTSHSNGTQCSQEKLHPATRQCEDSLLTLMSRWPMKANHTSIQSSDEHGKSLVCGDIASYKDCMLRALKSSGCFRQEVMQAIITEKGSSLHLPMCSTAPRILPELTLLGIIAGLSYSVST
ncbi:uncharacterized protein LOC135398680 [Ornithodoros turicata]|uniref:uncharacterized protein LOC135398680 n=1 Tax=Ornithodoros turicata TaxID=34597 RepID=UPI0031397DCD